jgi:RND family efflux transporter MFP subunit
MRLAVLALLPLALTACKPQKAAPPVPRPVVSEIVGPRAGLQQSYAGTVAARTKTDLGFPIAGTLAELPVQEGDVVAAGATLALIDPQQLDAEMRAAQAGVSVASAQLNSAHDAARRADALVAKGVDSPAVAEAAKSALIAAQSRLAQARASLAQARELRGFATLTAPQAGVITHVYVQPGASVTAGQAVVRLAATGEREVLIDLSEQDAAGLAPGAVFRVKLEAAPRIASTATLRLIDPVADPATRTRRLHLTLAPAAADAFRLGALVLVEPDARTRARITLPATALIGGKPDVWVVDRADDTVHRLAVRLGPRTGDRIVIRSGLKPGQEVVTRGVNSIKDGQVVGPRVPA